MAVVVDPLVLILLGAGVVSTFVGELVDGAIITAIVVLSIALNFLQTYRSQRAVKRQQLALVAEQ